MDSSSRLAKTYLPSRSFSPTKADDPSSSNPKNLHELRTYCRRTYCPMVALFGHNVLSRAASG